MAYLTSQSSPVYRAVEHFVESHAWWHAHGIATLSVIARVGFALLLGRPSGEGALTLGARQPMTHPLWPPPPPQSLS